MAKKRYRPEEIIGKLREADVLISQGKKVVDVIKAFGVTDVTYYRWRQEFGGMSVSQAKRLKELEKENEQLPGRPVQEGPIVRNADIPDNGRDL
jgi:putative transposase